jgi:hypothetical protein
VPGDQLTTQQFDQDLDCADFSSREEAQAGCESDPSDPQAGDADNDGQACEEFDYSGAATSGDGETTTAQRASDSSDASLARVRCEQLLRVVRNADRDQYFDSRTVESFEECMAEEILADTIPDKVLPNTGGRSVLLAPWVLALAMAGIMLLRKT